MAVSPGTPTPTYRWYDPRRRDTVFGYILLGVLIILLILWMQGRLITTPVVIDTSMGQVTPIPQPAYGARDEKATLTPTQTLTPVPPATAVVPTSTPAPPPGGAGDSDAP